MYSSRPTFTTANHGLRRRASAVAAVEVRNVEREHEVLAHGPRKPHGLSHEPRPRDPPRAGAILFSCLTPPAQLGEDAGRGVRIEERRRADLDGPRPVSRNSTAPTPDTTPPMLMIGTLGSSAANIGDGAGSVKPARERRSRQPAAAATERAGAGVGPDRKARKRVHERERRRVAWTAAAATSTRLAVPGEKSFTQRGRPAAAAAATTSAVAMGERANLPAVVEVRARHVDLDGDDRVGRRGDERRSLGVLLHAPSPDAHDDAGARRLEGRQVAGEPRRDAGALEPDAVSASRRKRASSAAAGSPAKVRGQRIHDDGAERGEVER